MFGFVAPRKFVAMTMVGQIQALYPQNGSYPSAGPFSDFTVGSTRLTGKVDRAFSGCTQFAVVAGNTYCKQITSGTYYRALTRVTVILGSQPSSASATSATSAIAPSLMATSYGSLPNPVVDTTEPSLP